LFKSRGVTDSPGLNNSKNNLAFMKSNKNIFQILINIFSWIFIGVFLTVFAVTAAGNLNVLGEYKSLIVQSGSMEPSIMTGDVILVAKSLDYRINDVITFNDYEGSITTHRIAGITAQNSDVLFATKGDANREQDSENIPQDQIIGKVILTVPKLGYFISFVRSGTGMIIFIIVPAMLIVFDEIFKIINTVKEKKNVS